MIFAVSPEPTSSSGSPPRSTGVRTASFARWWAMWNAVIWSSQNHSRPESSIQVAGDQLEGRPEGKPVGPGAVAEQVSPRRQPRGQRVRVEEPSAFGEVAVLEADTGSQGHLDVLAGNEPPPFFVPCGQTRDPCVIWTPRQSLEPRGTGRHTPDGCVSTDQAASTMPLPA